MQFLQVALLSMMMLVTGPVEAVQPDEMLADPVLEARAQAIGEELRCPVCRSESIEESNADLARDLRVLVRERLKAGDSDAEVKQFLVERYGEFILLRPRFSLENAALWLAGPTLFLTGLAAAWAFLRRRRPDAKPQRLSAEERETLDRILQQKQ